MLTKTDTEELIEFRHFLHRHPEISGDEVGTAKAIVNALETLSATRIVNNLGGHGVAAVFDSGNVGPTVLFRAELDALPIQELSKVPWASETAGVGHMCGHDGHMVLLLGLGRILSRVPTARGRVVLMFQPSEEDGSGARAVVSAPVFQTIAPDYAFAIHVEPGRPFGYVSTRVGLINCASKGLEISLSGKTAHAADPEDGISPAVAIAKLIPELNALGKGGPLDDQFRLLTITHAQLGDYSFGIAPGNALINVTLRTAFDDAMEGLEEAVKELVCSVSQQEGLAVSFREFDAFAATVNDAEATQIATNAMNALGISSGDLGLPMRASEDFGVFGWSAKAAMLCLGPGDDYAALHSQHYDFPDKLIPVGVSIFERITRDILGHALSAQSPFVDKQSVL